jgi:dihydroorotate dehydrogenase/NAD-dependent dihydropyrimidine dehydrogenase PreA subunit
VTLDLSTTFVGVKIKNPIIIASSPLTENIEAIIRCEKNGAGSVIIKSCSSTRLGESGSRRCFIDNKGWWAASTFNREIQDVHETVVYLRQAVRECSIPIFASVSELTLDPTKWLNTCKIVQQTGIAGIQLDLFYFENVLSEQGFTDKFARLLSCLKDSLTVPIFPKLNVNLPTLLMSDIFKKSGINDVSLLDSVSLPAPISVNKNGLPMLRFATNINRASLFGAWQFPLTLKYLYDLILAGFSVCAGGGIQSSSDIVELILLGANAIQIATSIILKGYSVISEYVVGIEKYMMQNGLKNISDFKGTALPHLNGKASYNKAKVRFKKHLCSKCNKCVSQGFCRAILRESGETIIDDNICEGCSLCVDLCPSNALYLEAVE